MKQRLIQQVGRSARLSVLNELKRTQGLCVADLAARLKMSYMGVKGICLDLEKRGLLDTWRQAQKIGRPQMLYRVTQRAHDLFPTESNSMTLDLLESARKLFGAASAEKLLLVTFQKKAEQYQLRLRGETLEERVKWLARLRDNEGCMAEYEADAGGGFRILEHHSPILDLLRAFPIISKMETEMFQRLLGVEVRREEEGASGLFLATYFVGA